jgi:hypothetical protein
MLCIGERNHFHTGPINIGILWFSQSPNGFRLVLQEMVLSARPVATALVLVLHIVLCFWIYGSMRFFSVVYVERGAQLSDSWTQAENRFLHVERRSDIADTELGSHGCT